MREVTQRRCAPGLKYSFACMCFMQNKLQKETTEFMSLNTTRANLEAAIHKAINSVQDHPFDIITYCKSFLI